jgi:hypothetical protein
MLSVKGVRARLSEAMEIAICFFYLRVNTGICEFTARRVTVGPVKAIEDQRKLTQDQGGRWRYGFNRNYMYSAGTARMPVIRAQLAGTSILGSSQGLNGLMLRDRGALHGQRIDAINAR